MRISNKRLAIIAGASAAGVLAIGLTVGVIASAGAAAASPTDGPIFLWDGNAGDPREDAGYVYAYDQPFYWSADADDILAPIVCPVGSTGVETFIAQPGRERSGTDGWTARSVSGFNPNPDVEGRLEVLTPAASLSYQSDGPAAEYEAIKKNGGNFSLGVACTSGGDQEVTAAFYRSIHVEAGSGDFTADPVSTKK